MIFQRSLTRELTLNTSGTLLVLLAIMLVITIAQTVRRVALGGLNPEALLAFLAFTTIRLLPMLLGLAVFIGVLMTLTRMYRDSEMTVWFSAGLSLASWVRPVLSFAVPVALLIMALSVFVSPWAKTQLELFQASLDGRSEISLIRPGVFTQAKDSDQVFFVDQISSEGDPLQNVFMQSWRDDKLGVMAAARGAIETRADGAVFAILSDGRRYEGTPGTPEFRQFDFEKLSIRLRAKQVKQVSQKVEAMGIVDLLTDGSAEPIGQRAAELHGRIAFPIAAILMALVAIPLSFVNPRAGRSWNMLLAILIAFIYYNTITMFGKLIEQGKISPLIGIFPVHGLIILLLLALFTYRLVALKFLLRGSK